MKLIPFSPIGRIRGALIWFGLATTFDLLELIVNLTKGSFILAGVWSLLVALVIWSARPFYHDYRSYQLCRQVARLVLSKAPLDSPCPTLLENGTDRLVITHYPTPASTWITRSLVDELELARHSPDEDHWDTPMDLYVLLMDPPYVGFIPSVYHVHRITADEGRDGLADFVVDGPAPKRASRKQLQQLIEQLESSTAPPMAWAEMGEGLWVRRKVTVN